MAQAAEVIAEAKARGLIVADTAYTLADLAALVALDEAFEAQEFEGEAAFNRRYPGVL